MRQIHFTTVNPGVSAKNHWLSIVQQIRPLAVSSANLRWDPGRRRFAGNTENVALLELRLNHVASDQPLQVQLDGQTLERIAWPQGTAALALPGSGCVAAGDGAGRQPSKGRADTARSRRPSTGECCLCTGRRARPRRPAWALNKARLDAETFYYRGNGSIDILPDTGFDPKADPDRSVILYGNKETNLAWRELLGSSPVQVDRRGVTIGDRDILG